MKERWAVRNDLTVWPGFESEEECWTYIKEKNIGGNAKAVRLTAEKELKLGFGRWHKRPMHREFQETEHTYGKDKPIGPMVEVDAKEGPEGKG